MSSSHHYLVEMTFPPAATLLSPPEIVAFTERMVLPTLDALEKLTASGQILAGGPLLATTGFAFIARAGSPPELEDVIASLPLWGRAQTRVVPLGTFALRAATIRDRLTRLPATASPSAPVAPRS